MHASYREVMEAEDMTVMFFHAPGKLLGPLLGSLQARLMLPTVHHCRMDEMIEGTGIIL